MYFVFCIYRKAVYRAANALFGKIGLIVSEDVILQLLQSTHIYNTLLYGVDIKTLRVFRQNWHSMATVVTPVQMDDAGGGCL